VEPIRFRLALLGTGLGRAFNKRFQKTLGDSMAQYKTVQVPNISIGHDGSTQEALNQFQNAIEKEASEGWELVCSHAITVTQDSEPIGCLGMLLILFKLKERQEAKTYRINMLIFVKN
jgi:RNA-binding protein YhbY